MTLKKYGLPIAIVAIALGIFYLLQITAPTANSHALERIPVSVTTTKIKLASLPLRVRSQGTVRPRTETRLTSQVAGEITWVSPTLKSGGRFAGGETLLQIDPSDHEVALQQAQADLSRSEAELSLAQTELERVTALHKRALVSEAQLQQAQRNVDVAEAMKLSAASASKRAKLDIERTTIVAPYSGRVRTSSADLGQFVQRGHELATLYATDRVEIRLPLPDAQLAYLDPALVRAGVLPGNAQPAVTIRGTLGGQARQWQGSIVRTEGEIDQSSRMVHVVAEVANDDSPESLPLPVGLFVDSDIEGITVEGVAEIPRAAILPGDRVLLVDEDNRLHFRSIELLRLSEHSALVKSGLMEGDVLCVTRLQAPVEGMQVTPVQEGR